MAYDARDRLRRAGLRVTAQRRAILDAFRDGGSEHLSAEQVHARASAVVPELSRGTVYVTLAELVELGLIGSIGNPEPVRYEINTTPHDHFRCRLCLRLYDVDLGSQQIATEHLKGFRVERLAVDAEGVCAECADYQDGLSEGVDMIATRRLLDAEAIAGYACAQIPSPLGDLVLAASAQGVVRVAFEHHADFGALATRAESRGEAAARGRLDRVTRSLDEYFRGSQQPFSDAIDWQLVSELQAESLDSTSHIPYGDSVSYEHIRDQLTPRECGLLMGANPVPLLIPCHRISCGGYRPEVYVGGTGSLEVLHALEAD